MRKLDWIRASLACVLVWSVVGCATQQQHAVRFDPLPAPEVGKDELETASPATTTELLREADKAFKAANQAQEAGDAEAALRHYQRMLAILMDADLDPVIFYNLRNEFGQILDSTSQQANLFEQGRPREYNNLDLSDTGVMGDLPIPFPLPEAVLREIEEIQEVYPRGFQAGLDRSFKYAPMVRRKLAEAGLPQDLVWLAMVESQFKSSARSHAGAVGMWQFMSQTGQRYGLRVDSEMDERRNWERATDAAIAYLGDLHDMFGEWPLAVSAYNMGEYGLQRTINAADGEKDLWRLMETSAGQRYMRLETRKFYPKLVASIIVASSPERYGFSINPEQLEQYVRVAVNGSYSLHDLERASGLSRGILEELNPDLIRGVTPRSGTYMVAVPVEANAKFIAALSEVGKTSERVVASTSQEGGTYVVQRGDTLSEIAERFRISSRTLMKANGIKSAQHLQAGKRLTIPGVAVTASAKGERPAYRIRRGDTLTHIAQRFGVGLEDIEHWNGISRKSSLRVNQVLFVGPPEQMAAAGSSGQKQIHVVRSGEYPGLIAEKYNVALADLLRWNDLTRHSVIKENDKLVVYLAGSGTVQTASSASSEPAKPGAPVEQERVHVVAKGDTASTIAERYGVGLSQLLSWNNLTKRSVLRVGDKLVIRGGSTASTTSEAEKAVFRVAKGQSPWTIARDHGVTTSQILEWNGWSKNKVLRVGDQYVVYKGSAAKSDSGPIVHEVRSGENPWVIAQRYDVSLNDLLTWNGWNKNTVLRVGDRVTIYR